MTKRKPTTDAMKYQALKRAEVNVRCIGCIGENNSLRRQGREGHFDAFRDEWHPLDHIHFDHVQAIVDDGAHAVENLRPLCGYHNLKKGSFEHSRNSKSKRLAKARAEHEAVVDRVTKRAPGKIKSAGFPKGWKKPMRGRAYRV